MRMSTNSKCPINYSKLNEIQKKNRQQNTKQVVSALKWITEHSSEANMANTTFVSHVCIVLYLLNCACECLWWSLSALHTLVAERKNVDCLKYIALTHQSYKQIGVHGKDIVRH